MKLAACPENAKITNDRQETAKWVNGVEELQRQLLLACSKPSKRTC